MRIDQLSMNLIDQLRAWFHPKDRHLYLGDDQWILSRRVAWETAVSKFLIPPGIRGFWPMSAFDASGNAVDQSGFTRNLTYNGNPIYSFYDDLVPYIDFDGVDDFLSRADEGGIDITGSETYVASAVRGLTMGGWFWADSLAATADLMAKWTAAGNQRSYLLELNTNGTILAAITNDGTASIISVTSSNAITVSSWFFVVMRFIPSVSIDIFLNGTKTTNTSSIPSSIFNSTTAFTIGSRAGPLVLFNGRASLCFLCANALPDELISMLYEQTRRFFGVGA